MAYKFTFPFVPPKEDLKLVKHIPGKGTCYVYDTCVVRDPVERARIDAQVSEILTRAEIKRRMREMEDKDE